MRYSRQEKLAFIPDKFNQITKNKKIILVGCGGIGSPLSEMLVRGGFNNLTLIDQDLIDETNLQRQVFFEEDIGKYKAKALKKYLLNIDSKSSIKVINTFLDEKNISEICLSCDLIVDATDNFKTRKIINIFCEENNKDWLYNGAIRSEVISCMFYGKDKLFNKVFKGEIEDESCCTSGVLVSTTFTSASLAYNQILKYFIGLKESKLIKMDIWKNQIFEVKLK